MPLNAAIPPGLQNPMAWSGAAPVTGPAVLVTVIAFSDGAAAGDDSGLGFTETDAIALSDGAAAADAVQVRQYPSSLLPWTVVAAQDSGSTGQIVVAAADALSNGLTIGQQFQLYSGQPSAGGVPAVARVNANCSFEAGTSPWTAVNGATLAQSTTDPWTLDGGTHSCKMTPNGSTAAPQMLSESIAVVPGTLYVTCGGVTPSATWASGVQTGINWYASGGSLISSSACTAVPVTASTRAVAQLQPAYPPSAAVTLKLFAQAAGTPPNSTVFYWDLVYAALYNALLSPQVYTITGLSTTGSYTTVSFTPAAASAPVFGIWMEQLS